MARVLIATAREDFDPSEVAIPWKVLSALGHAVTFATPDGTPAFVVRDGRYVSARWPGDAHTFAKTLAGVIAEAG
jgi:putative intracellular protease/amidase